MQSKNAGEDVTGGKRKIMPEPSQNPGDAEITLTRGHLNLRVSAYGASLRGLWHIGADGQTRDIIRGYVGAKGKVGGQGDVLIPFPGRVRDGHYTFEGQSYQMEKNDKETPGAIHGFVRQTVWDIAAQTEHGVTFATDIKPDDHAGYPFGLHIEVTYTLQADGLTCRFEIENTGGGSAPAAAGFHPYFTVGSPRINGDLLRVPFASTLEFADLLPTGSVLPVANTPFDFRQPRAIGDTTFNTCFLDPLRDPDGLLRLRLSTSNVSAEDSTTENSAAENDTTHQAERALTVWMDSAFNYVVLYSGDPLPDPHRRAALAIEPMTCGTDAFNRPEWGLVTLAPGQTVGGAWGVVTSIF